MDKSWTSWRKRGKEYWECLQAFLAMASAYKNSDRKIRCPCVRCLNTRFEPLNIVEAHIFDWGFDNGYQKWIYHGEPEVEVPRNEVSRNEVLESILDDEDDEMIPIIEDFIRPTTEEVQTNPDSFQYYDDLFEEIEAELYPGCHWISSLNFLAKLLHLKVRGKIPISVFDELLKLLNLAFPKGNKVPSTYYEAKKRLKKLGLGYESIHVCEHDCCLFYKEHATKDACPICGSSRWITSTKTNGKKVPRKVLRYFPLTPRLKRLYGSRHTAKYMVWHHTGKSKDERLMRHPVDGLAWKDFDAKHPNFASEPRNVRLGLAADGFNPFGNMSLAYSMWPVVLANYNLPPWMCMKDNNFMVALLIPGPKSPGKDMDVFLRPLVDELKELWVDGVDTRDCTTNTMFKLRAALLWTVNDFPAPSSLSGWSGQGYKACPTCNEDTTSIRVIGKTSYVGHRRFLPSNHRFRRDTNFDGEIERRHPPRRFTCEEILEQVNKLVPQIPGKHEQFGGVKRRRVAEDQNWRKKSIFYELEYWCTNTLKHNIDVMHVEKNVCDSLLGTILDNDKSKDTTNARHDLKKLGIREWLWIYEDDNDKLMKPHAPYVLKADEKLKFCQFINDVKFPDGFCSNLKKKVSNDLSNVLGLKSHDCHVIIQRLLAIGVRKFLPKNVSTTIAELCNFFRQVCARTINFKDMEEAQKDLILILCKLELIFPPAFFDIMIHLVLHLPEEAILGGPVFMRWMYPFERYMKKLKNYVGNKARPEGSIAESYVADEALTFCSMYFKGVETKFNRLDRNEDEVIPRILTVFQSQCHPLTRANIMPLDRKTRENAEWFIFDNSPEIRPYLDEHLEEIKLQYPDGDHNILHKKFFQRWFHKKIYDLHKLGSWENGEELLALACGSDHLVTYYEGVVVNGVRYMVAERDKKRTTQNSGVSVAGTEGFNYYGTLEDVMMFTFCGVYSVTLFRCKWFNTNPQRKKTIIENNIISINVSGEWYKDDPFILATQAKQVFYLDDLLRGRHWKIVENVNHRQIWDIEEDEDDEDIVHDLSSSNFRLTVDIGELILQHADVATIIDPTQNLNVNQPDENVVDGDVDDVIDDEVDELLIDRCEDDIDSENDECDSDY
ncbi:uncharacterized protein LOC133032365 [Cannabis sativa]|uniref:uncharacterized protein LOC133032365 n=1 Tax=Cannabis sativa TaxID=3483 RepID=UPI0029C9EC53|nr:uncharacterized protein LOC133032365 [Cannabis sativa]